MEPDRKRIADILELRFEKELKLREIGSLYGLTGERVRQIISKNTPDGGSGFTPIKKVHSPCKQCGKPLLHYPRIKKVYCNKSCRSNFAFENRHCNHCGITENIIKNGDGWICTTCNTDRARRYRSTKKGKIATRRSSAKQLIKFRDKQNARNLFNYHLKRNYVKKPDHCSLCDNVFIHAHHPDYSKPLDVVWLCPKHHSELHKKIKVNSAFDKSNQIAVR